MSCSSLFFSLSFFVPSHSTPPQAAIVIQQAFRRWRKMRGRGWKSRSKAAQRDAPGKATLKRERRANAERRLAAGNRKPAGAPASARAARANDAAAPRQPRPLVTAPKFPDTYSASAELWMKSSEGPSLTEVLGKSGQYRRMRREKRGLPPLDMAEGGSGRVRIRSSTMQRPVMGMQRGEQQRLLQAALRAKEAQMRRSGLGGTRRTGPKPSWDDSILVPQVGVGAGVCFVGPRCAFVEQQRGVSTTHVFAPLLHRSRLPSRSRR